MDKKQTYYFIGINGIGMSGLAEMLASQGHTVKGSDCSASLRVDHFKSCGIDVHQTHNKDNIECESWIIVISSAIKSNNDELVKANGIGCKVLKRGELLAMVIEQFKHSIAIVGTHGKTTTSSLLLQIFNEWVSPSYFVGGHLSGRSHAKLTDSEWFITELDESDGSFLDASPSQAIITNVELDHVDFYQTKEDVTDAFSSFMKKVFKSNGCCAINLDDPISEKLYKKSDQKESCITYAVESKSAQIRAENIEYSWNGLSFSLVINNTNVDKVRVPLFGKHNVYNSLSAISIAIHNEIPLKHILDGLAKFKGVKRRLELKYKANDIVLYDDYAHHPTEIISTLEGLYKSFSQNRIITIFQPHRFSRLTNLFNSFASSFSRSTKTCILPVFSAGEKSDGHMSSIDLVNKINENGSNAFYFDSFQAVISNIKEDLQANDIILVMGAGSVTQISKDLIPIIKKAR
ncbi:MAG: UDP-N-acetylmuramate--L-alanine ligase [Candidatus Margulisiibacteriota bacterium]|nr:UDP-N-acetylmuramate--L-alanine ligase [Candidatus Margulisiibacteriota bacterium]